MRVLSPNEEGIGEIAARSKTVMSHYLDDAELTLETIVDGWLLTGDLGRFDKSGHLQLFGRKKNMIVTEGGKNIYPEDIETVFDGLPVKEYCVFAANYVWPQKKLGREMLVMVLRLEQNQRFDSALLRRWWPATGELPDFKRVGGYVIWEKDFPRTASMKIKRQALAEETGKDGGAGSGGGAVNATGSVSGHRESCGGRRAKPQDAGPGFGAVASGRGCGRCGGDAGCRRCYADRARSLCARTAAVYCGGRGWDFV